MKDRKKARIQMKGLMSFLAKRPFISVLGLIVFLVVPAMAVKAYVHHHKDAKQDVSFVFCKKAKDSLALLKGSDLASLSGCELIPRSNVAGFEKEIAIAGIEVAEFPKDSPRNPPMMNIYRVFTTNGKVLYTDGVPRWPSG